MRTRMLAAREAEPEREHKSDIIQACLLGLPEFAGAGTVLSYVGVKSEVSTAEVISAALGAGKRLAVPYVTPDGLGSARIHSAAELGPARFGLLEPLALVRNDPARNCPPSAVDLFVVPGVAFDRAGGRLGHGKAYYDRLLARAGEKARFIALAFECQLVDRVPMEASDVFMHAVVTEAAVYRR